MTPAPLTPRRSVVVVSDWVDGPPAGQNRGSSALLPAHAIDSARHPWTGDLVPANVTGGYLERLPLSRPLHATVVLASSGSQDDLDHYLDLLDAHDMVTATTSADDVDNTKPAPNIFAIALKKVAPLRADEIVVVGDAPYDVEAAAKCGIAAIGLRSGGFGDDSLLRDGAIALYDDVAALLADYDTSPLGHRP